MPKPANHSQTSDPNATITLSSDAFAPAPRFGDYELLEEIARGGMGVVWKARQISLNRTVALKMILAGKLASETEVQRFRREAEAAANLQHPNIVAIHEVREQDGQHYYSMDYIEGRDLAAIVSENGPLPPERAADCVKTIAEAVHFAHQRGTLHRDLKPQNVLMDAAAVPHITDFGLAKFIARDESLTQTGAAMGSPSYMPPEQAVGHLDQIGPHSDVYSLGAILYELLTGRPPFRAETAMATMRLVMESDPVAPRKINHSLPPDLETICLKCLEKNPARRYNSARALAEDLGRFLKHEPIQAVPVSPVRKAESWLRRHPWTLVAAGSSIVMVLAGLLYWQYQRVKFLESKSGLAGQAPLNSGMRVQDLQSWADACALVSVVVCVLVVYRRFSEGSLARKRFFLRPTDWEPAKPMSQSMRLVCGVASLAAFVFILFYFAKVIQVSVWDKPPGVPQLVWVYGFLTMTLQLLIWVVRDYLRFVHGLPSRVLSAAQTEPLRQAILDSEIPNAIKLYRQTFPEASREEASEFVGKLAAELKTKHPERFQSPKPWDLNWREIGRCLLLEAALFVLFWMLMPPVASAQRLLASAAGFLFGAGFIFSMRLGSFWPRRLGMMLCASLAGLAPNFLSHSAIAWEALAFAFGLAAMVRGSRRKHGKST